ncbi:cytosine-specific methyltransferase [Fulvitalea axinellae]|uniref:Cytosine-specific methyltransferase n=1 Tax=Fulvitalea axinellae TaxID=1182444 RepID=A0AAU9D5M8_9BACT|nr:cytosine-specific methyltransferase [Fulvitalea axinellae]
MYKVGSLYAGVGGVCMGFMNAGAELAWANEWDAKACVTYRHNFGHKLYEGDVMELDPEGLAPVDILAAGFPCQPFSVAGYRKGFGDERGNHFFRIMKYVEVLKPKVIFLENVKNLQGHDNGNTFRVIQETIEAAGYSFDAKVLNTKDYGNIPHNRERIFIVAFRNDADGGNKAAERFAFPEPEELTRVVGDVVDFSAKVDKAFYYGKDRYMYPELKKHMTNPDTVYQWRRLYVRENKSNVCPTLTANMGTGGHNVPLVVTKHGFRKLTPKECFLFQGFPEDYKLPAEMAKSHLYKQAGNSVSVPVIERIAEKIIEAAG